jgi:hypothetical protein
MKPTFFKTICFWLFIFIMLKNNAFAQKKNYFEELCHYYVQDGQTIAWLEFSEEQLAHLSLQELRLLRNHFYARHGYIFKSEDLKKYFSKFDWYAPRLAKVESLLNTLEKSNIELIKCFENAQRITPSPITGLDSRSWLKGCWQAGSTTVATGYQDRFSFALEDYSFAFIGGDTEENISTRNLNFSGRFTIPDKNKIEFEIITKDVLVKFPGPVRKDPKTGKEMHTTGLRIETKHYEKSEGYDYKSVELSDIVHYTNPDGIEKYFVKINGQMYWRISLEICEY